MPSPERYLNHGCDPNVYVYALASDRFDRAMRDMAAREELLFDYAIDLVNRGWLDGRFSALSWPTTIGLHHVACLEATGVLALPFLPIRAHHERIRHLLQGEVRNDHR
jgi:hypothetical protein